MKMLGRVAAIAIVSALGLIPVHAIASTILWDFTVTVTSGPLAGQILSGSFGYDSSSITPGAFNNNADLLTQLNFTFEGTTYNATTANTGFLGFDTSGALNLADFGNNCYPSACHLIQPGTDQWFVFSDFSYSEPGYRGVGLGDVVFTPVSTPEPATWAMLLAGFFGIGAMARRVRRSSRAALA
jgi:hypothetical protein